MEQDPYFLLQDAEALLQERNVTGALLRFHAAEQAGADVDRCSAGRWLAHMLAGNFNAAWCQSDAILERGAPDQHRFWMGEEIDGKTVMLRCLHGFGDSVLMLRYAPQLRVRAAKLIVEVDPRFVELARCFDGVDHVVPWGEQAPISSLQWDVQMEVTELPYFFRTTIADLPVASSYLHLPCTSERVLKPGTENHLRVGLVWASGSWNPSRSIAPQHLCSLLQLHGCEFWNLQGGKGLEQAAVLCAHANFHTDPQCGDSLLRLAHVISEMDLVITSDTLAAHLAGALGVRALGDAATRRGLAMDVEPGGQPMVPITAALSAIRGRRLGERPRSGTTAARRTGYESQARSIGALEMMIANSLPHPWDYFDAYLFDIDGTLIECTDGDPLLRLLRGVEDAEVAAT